MVQKWLELALNVCGRFNWCKAEKVLVINSTLVIVAVVGRHSINPGILAVALSQAAAISIDLSQAVVEWTSSTLR